MIAGFEEPTNGRILLQGRDVTYVPPARRNVNMVFQAYALFPHMTVWDNVAYGPRSQKKDKATVRKSVDEMLDVVRLTEMLAAVRASAGDVVASREVTSQ